MDSLFIDRAIVVLRSCWSLISMINPFSSLLFEWIFIVKNELFEIKAIRCTSKRDKPVSFEASIIIAATSVRTTACAHLSIC